MVLDDKFDEGNVLAASGIANRVIGALILVYCLPLIAVIALALKLSDGGPVLERVTRITLHGRRIEEWRFRTAAPGDLPGGSCIGGLLRLTRLELLPQVFNVVSGELAVTAMLR